MTKILKENEEIDCPMCKQKHIMTLYDSVNVRLNPELKEKVFNGEINALPCSYGVLLGPFLYVDGNKWIWLYPWDQGGQKEKINAQIKQRETETDKLFGKNQIVHYYVFGYGQFRELSEMLDKEENSQNEET